MSGNLRGGFTSADCAAWVSTGAQCGADEVLTAAARAIGDTAVAMIVGVNCEVTDHVRAAVTGYGEGPCTVVGQSVGLPAPNAAFVNGVAAHAAEVDDNFMAAGTHGSAVLLPALLAAGEIQGASGREILEAFAVGLQVQWRMSQAMNPAHGLAGWHPTGTIAAVGAAAACARLQRLNPRQTHAALGLAASQMGGGNAQFGAMAKPVHAGSAARAGVLSADLAAAGVTAGAQALEQIMQLMGGDLSAFPEVKDYGAPVALTALGVTPKIWPTCGSTHPAIHAIRRRPELRDNLQNIALIEVLTPAVLNGNLLYTDPRTEDEARFSLEFAVATALVDGDVGLASLTSEMRGRKEIRSLMGKVRRQIIPNDFADLRLTVVVRSRDRTSLSSSSSLDELPGSLASPLGDRDYIRKLWSSAAGRLSWEAAEEAWSRLMAMRDTGGLAPIVAMLRVI